MNKKAYLKNVLDFHKEGLSLDDAINKEADGVYRKKIGS